VLYNFQNKYYLNASFRNDASSRMLKENRNQKFWSCRRSLGTDKGKLYGGSENI
jgi:hypothetical protein